MHNTITYDVTAEGEDAIIGWGIRFSPGDQPALGLTGTARSEQEVLGALISEGAPQMGRFLSDEAFKTYAPGKEWLVISDDMREISFPEFFAMCDDFIALLRQLVVEAREVFDSPSQPAG